MRNVDKPTIHPLYSSENLGPAIDHYIMVYSTIMSPINRTRSIIVTVLTPSKILLSHSEC